MTANGSSQETLAERVCRLTLAKVQTDKRSVSASDDLRKDLGMDSLDYVELLMDIEEEFQISLSDLDEMPKRLTVGQLIDVVESKVVTP